jgi:uncharacterized protein (DUF885 family)
MNLFLSAVLLSSGVAAQQAAIDRSAKDKINALADYYYDYQLKTHPEIAYFSGVEIQRHDTLTQNTPRAIAEKHAKVDWMLRELSRIDADELDGTVAEITHAYLEQDLRSERDLRVCRHELWGVNQMNGWQLTYTQLARLQPVGTQELRDQALRRFALLPDFIDQEIENLRKGLARDYSSPKAAVRRVIDQLDGLLEIPAADSPFASPARREEHVEFKQEFITLVAERILPAVQRYRDFLRDEYLERAREKLSITANPDGRKCYEASLRSYTTLDRAPEAVFELGQQTVEANRARVEKLGKSAYGLKDFDEIMERVKSDPNDRFGSREELLAFSKDAVSRAHKAVPDWFGHVPTRTAEVVPYDDYQDGTGVSARYEAGTPERPGIYRIPLYQPEEQSKGGAEATAFHEVWPGHHLQVSIAQEIEGLHPVTQIIWFSGMGEGWARYSESLADEMGLYETVTGPIRRLAWPARGMVVDPGIHLKGWTREQAIEFMGAAGRMTDHELEEMVDRIAVLPGQLTAYDSGGLEIFALRAEAEKKLRRKFDIKAFHDAVLKNGTVPLSQLREQVESWLEAQ